MKTRWLATRSLVLVIAVLAAAASENAAATLIDPNFFVCPDGVPIGSCSGDPNLLSQSKFGIYVKTPAGVNDPILIILAVPNTSTGATQSAPTIGTVAGGTDGIGGTNVYSGHWDTTTGVATAGQFTSTSGTGVYDFIGLVPFGNQSQNWSNYLLGGTGGLEYTTLGYLPSGFELYVYQVHEFLPDNTRLDIPWTSPIPLGTYVMAYGQSATHVYASPFTTGGLVNNCRGDCGGPPGGDMPEPQSLALVAIGLFAAGAFARRRLKSAY